MTADSWADSFNEPRSAHDPSTCHLWLFSTPDRACTCRDDLLTPEAGSAAARLDLLAPLSQEYEEREAT